MDTAAPKRHDHRIIIHFVSSCWTLILTVADLLTMCSQDYDCFYAAVFERADPSLKSLPLAVQQKQIIVTCNYEARRRGLYKLQLVREAREKCPDVIIVLGEDLTRFRDASKDNYNFLKSHLWSNRIERLGFDEVGAAFSRSFETLLMPGKVFMDVTDMIEYNLALLNQNHLSASFFHLHRADPIIGFPYDASSISGSTFPANASKQDAQDSEDPDDLLRRLCLGSHLAQHLRHLLEEYKGYTSTVGISTSKLLSKLVGNVNKPKSQTTLTPPYLPCSNGTSHVNEFIDNHDIGKIPGIGFKIAQKIRGHVLGRLAAHDSGLVYGGTKENVRVGDVRLYNEMGPKLLERILSGYGVPKDLPGKVWSLVNGVDDSEVAKGREVPQQISIEDSYIRLDEMIEVRKELKMLAASLIKRMRLDLTSRLEDKLEETPPGVEEILPSYVAASAAIRWIAHPRTIRLSTRPRPPLSPDGTRLRTFTRLSKSGPMPTFIFNLSSSIEVLSEKLLTDTLVPLFLKLHPEKSGWNLSLVNVCATNIAMTAGDGKDGAGRDISRMFKRQGEVLKEWKVEDIDMAPSDDELDETKPETVTNMVDSSETGIATAQAGSTCGPEDVRISTQESTTHAWDSEDEDVDMGEVCQTCGAIMPAFAMVAHNRFHDL